MPKLTGEQKKYRSMLANKSYKYLAMNFEKFTTPNKIKVATDAIQRMERQDKNASIETPDGFKIKFEVAS